MEQLDQIIRTISLSMGASWASGINLYATLLVLGIGQMTGNLSLPPDLQVLANPLVVGAAGLMYAVEFFADKMPGIDTGWDSIHTFIRIPAGAMLAFGMVGDVSQSAAVAAAIVGGTIAAGAHATKAGTRVMINTSPEPFTNWAASISEDILAVAGLWTAFNHPWIFTVLLILFILFVIWFLPKIWRGIKKIFGFLGRLLGISSPAEEADPPLEQAGGKNIGGSNPAGDLEKKIKALQDLLSKGLITEEEFSLKKQDLLDRI